MRQYRSPAGKLIVQTVEVLFGYANIDGFTDEGDPEYAGETDVDWDSQTTVDD